MFNYLATEYTSLFSYLNLFNYITFRTGAAILTSLFFSLIFGEIIISKLSQIQPIGQVWTLKIKDFDSFTSSCAKLMNSINLDGFVAIGQIVHGVSDGENAYIYGTYPDLNSAFITGPKNELEQKAFNSFFSEMSNSEAEYNQSFTRVLLKSYP